MLVPSQLRPSRRQRIAERLRGLQYGKPPWGRAIVILFFGVYDFAGGVSGLVKPDGGSPSYKYALQLMPLYWWWIGFVLVGLAELWLLRDPTLIGKVSIIGLAWSGLWAFYLVQTAGDPVVTGRAVTLPMVIAVGHLMLRVFKPPKAENPTTAR